MTPTQAGAGLIPAVGGTLSRGNIVKRIGEFYLTRSPISLRGCAGIEADRLAPGYHYDSGHHLCCVRRQLHAAGITVTAPLVAISRSRSLKGLTLLIVAVSKVAAAYH